jgi:hypothetical protein
VAERKTKAKAQSSKLKAAEEQTCFSGSAALPTAQLQRTNKTGSPSLFLSTRQADDVYRKHSSPAIVTAF